MPDNDFDEAAILSAVMLLGMAVQERLINLEQGKKGKKFDPGEAGLFADSLTVALIRRQPGALFRF
jgi:hypothetical protein